MCIDSFTCRVLKSNVDYGNVSNKYAVYRLTIATLFHVLHYNNQVTFHIHTLAVFLCGCFLVCIMTLMSTTIHVITQCNISLAKPCFHVTPFHGIFYVCAAYY